MTLEAAVVGAILLAAAAVTVLFLRRSLRARENPCGTCAGCPHVDAGGCPVPPEACGISRPDGGKTPPGGAAHA